MTECSFVSKSKTKDFTCLSKNDLIEIMKSIPLKYSNKTKKEIYNILKKILSEDERNWWKYDFLNYNLNIKLKYIAFKPLKPKGEWGWLSTDDISSIMYQKMENFKSKRVSFFYHGTYPSDYFKLNPDKINEINTINKENNVGMVLNTDISSKNGEHWIAIFLTKDKLYYFDPTGGKPNKYIKELINNIKQKRDIDINNIEYQKKDGTCGLYVIEFLSLMAENKPIKLEDDNHINKKRNKYFTEIKK